MTSGTAIAASCGWAGFRLGRNPAQRRVVFSPGHRVSNHLSRRSPEQLCRAKLATSRLRFLAIVVVGLCSGAPFAHAASVGTVTKVENQAQIGSTAAVVGSAVEANDRVRTGPKSRLEITFRDDTKLSVGENAEMTIDRFVFNPDQSTGELVLSTSAAAFRMATGKIGKMQNKTINVSTPLAALAVRGTDFWWGPVNGHSGTLLVSNSRVDVRNDDECDKTRDAKKDRERCRCAVTLDRAGEGTDIRRGACPGAPYQWPPGQVASALASTSFGLALGPGLAPFAAAGAGVAGAAAASMAGGNPPVKDFTKPPDDKAVAVAVAVGDRRLNYDARRVSPPCKAKN